MKSTLVVVLSAVASFAVTKGGNTTDAPVTWTLYSGYQQTLVNGATVVQSCDPLTTSGCIRSAIFGDGTSTYTNGSAGVTNAVIHFSSGTYDATLGFAQNSSRSFNFNFGARLAYNPAVTQPSWATQVVNGRGLLNISHILWPTMALGDTTESDYTTRFTSAVPNNSSYHIRMDSKNPVPDVDPTAPYYQDSAFNYNDPYETALVHVHHCPAGKVSTWCAGGKESWYVYPDLDNSSASTSTNEKLTGVAPAQVGTLVQDTGKGGLLAIGQYSVPFFFKIQLQ